MTAFRLTLDLDEETRARWQAAAERNAYERLEVWARDTLDAAADPDAGQVLDLSPDNDSIINGRLASARDFATSPGEPDGFAWSQAYRQDVTDLRARLTTAETELHQVEQEYEIIRAAQLRTEARVEAWKAWAQSMPDAGFNDQDPRWDWWHAMPRDET